MRILAAIAALSCAAFVAAVTYEVWPQRAEVAADVAAVFTSPAHADAVPAAALVTQRPVYRHSIVPGGAYSRTEVANAMRRDAVVAAHYQDIDVDNIHAKRNAAARAVYVSYRVGDRVYWTKNRVRLAPGETVLTDGETEIRARCGNLLSDHAQQPVAAVEPPLASLDDAEPETGSSTIAGARDSEGRLNHDANVPALASGLALGGADLPVGGSGPSNAPMWFGGTGGGASPNVDANPGVGGGSVAPLGGSQRANRGPSGGAGSKDEVPNGNGGGSSNGNGGSNDSNDQNGGGNGNNGSNGANGSNDHNGDGNGNNGKNGDSGNGSNGGGSNGGGSNGGGNNGAQPPTDYPTTTIGGTGTTTTGSPVDETTTTTGGAGDIDTTGGNDSTTTGGSDSNGNPPAVPEPGTLMLFTLGAIGVAARKVRGR